MLRYEGKLICSLVTYPEGDVGCCLHTGDHKLEETWDVNEYHGRKLWQMEKPLMLPFVDEVRSRNRTTETFALFRGEPWTLPADDKHHQYWLYQDEIYSTDGPVNHEEFTTLVHEFNRTRPQPVEKPIVSAEEREAWKVIADDRLWEVGFDFSDEGDKRYSLDILASILRQDPKNVEAWRWMATRLDDAEKKRQCWQRVLSLNPGDAEAAQALSVGEKTWAASEVSIPSTTSQVRPRDIDTIDPYEFESLIARLLEKMGLEVKETKRAGDGGIDVIARSDEPITGGLFAVQCKRYSSKVGEPKVRDLYGVVHHLNASKGILITNSDFTRQAREFAEGKPIELIDGDRLRKLLNEYGVIPEVEGKATVSASTWRLCRGLLCTAAKTDADLGKVDAILTVCDVTCSVSQFFEYIDLLIKTWERFLCLMKEFDTFTTQCPRGRGFSQWGEPCLGTITDDYQLNVVDRIVDELMRVQVRALASLRIERDLEPSRQAALECSKALLTGFSRFARELYAELKKKDGKLVETDANALTLSIELDLGGYTEWLEKLLQEKERYKRTHPGHRPTTS